MHRLVPAIVALAPFVLPAMMLHTIHTAVISQCQCVNDWSFVVEYTIYAVVCCILIWKSPLEARPEAESMVKSQTHSFDPTQLLLLRTREIAEHHNDMEPNHASHQSHTQVTDPASMAAASVACPICLEVFQPGDQVTSGTSCSHELHVSCMQQWLGHCRVPQSDAPPSCPCCRQDLWTASRKSNAKNVLSAFEMCLE